MKYIAAFLILALSIYSCDTGKSTVKSGTSDEMNTTVANDTVRIANDELEYEILIIEPGFNSWLISQPPQGFYGLTFLENKNRNFVIEYNTRVRSPQQYSTLLYEQEINYNSNTEYGLEVNYKLYNYFVYFQQKYNQKFRGGRN